MTIKEKAFYELLRRLALSIQDDDELYELAFFFNKDEYDLFIEMVANLELQQDENTI